MMAVTLTTAEKALKDIYLSVVTDQLNLNSNPLYNRIKTSTNYVSGKDVVKLVRVGVNGGVGAGSEDGNLPSASGNRYVRFQSPLKNLFGQLEISDKAVLASNASAGAFVNLLNDEMEGLLKASKYHFSRMLFGDGTGTLATAVNGGVDGVMVDSLTNLAEGMVVDVLDPATGLPIANGERRTITSITREVGHVTLVGSGTLNVSSGHLLALQGSYKHELTGLEALFQSGALYGVDRTANPWMKANKATVAAISDNEIQLQMDKIDERSGGAVDFIVCSYDVRRAYVNYLAQNSRNLDVLSLEGGHKAISFAGIPVYADRFCSPKTMYLLDTSAFALHQLCDWRWMEDTNGHILHQVNGKPMYTATLVKYAELMCDKPAAQAKLTFTA